MTDDRPKLKLVGEDGNCFNLLGLAKKAAREADWPGEKWLTFFKEAISGDYDHLLQTCIRYFDVE